MILILLAGLGTGFFIWRDIKKDGENRAEQGQIKGVTIENAPVEIQAKDDPQSLLPVETYFGKISDHSVQAIFDSRSIRIVPEDVVKVFPDPSLGIGSKITIFRSTPIKIADANDPPQNYHTWTKTVDELLKEKIITIGKDDVIEPRIETALEPNLEIKITRVKFTEIKEEEKIPFKTLTKDDPDRLKGEQAIEQEGQEGKKEKYYEVRRENGKAVAKKLTREVIAREATDRVIIRGVKEPSKQNYGEGLATWYDWISGMTAAHNSLKYGTKVRVTNTKNNKTVVVTIVDHGIKGRAIIDLSKEAFKELAPLGQGVVQVKIEEP